VRWNRPAWPPRQIDAVVVSTCTGYLCPGLSGYVAERLGLRADVMALDLVGQGCAAALPNLQLARALLQAGTADHVLSVCVEVSSAAMYLDNDPGVIISACLFGDGAGAAVLSRNAGAGRHVVWKDSASLLEPGQRSALMFEQRDGMLRNILTRAVPALASEYAARVLSRCWPAPGCSRLTSAPGSCMPAGRDVLQALQHKLELQPEDLRYSAAMLREYGNLSSAFVYFVLQAALADGAAPGWWWLSSFGAGFSCHGALLEVQSMSPRVVTPETLDHLAGRRPVGPAVAPRPGARAPRHGHAVHHRPRLASPDAGRPRVVTPALLELGAGDGTLLLGVARQLHGAWPAVRLTLLDKLDLVSPPPWRPMPRWAGRHAPKWPMCATGPPPPLPPCAGTSSAPASSCTTSRTGSSARCWPALHAEAIASSPVSPTAVGWRWRAATWWARSAPMW
jgi:predicted naringenin-chalcone synthase